MDFWDHFFFLSVLDASGWVVSDSASPIWTDSADVETPQLGSLRVIMQNGVKGPGSTLHIELPHSYMWLSFLSLEIKIMNYRGEVVHTEARGESSASFCASPYLTPWRQDLSLNRQLVCQLGWQPQDPNSLLFLPYPPWQCWVIGTHTYYVSARVQLRWSCLNSKHSCPLCHLSNPINSLPTRFWESKSINLITMSKIILPNFPNNFSKNKWLKL